MDEMYRLLLSFFLFWCCFILSEIFTKKKSWDMIFWICFAIFLVSLAGYGHIVHHIYLKNTFSYDGFISSASFLTIVGILFGQKRYIKFSDKIISKSTPMMLALFTVFAFIYVSTIDFDPACVTTISEFFNELLQVVVYPLMLLFAITAFLFRFSVCGTVFLIYLMIFVTASFINMIDRLTAIIPDVMLTEETIFSIISIVFTLASITVLVRAKKIYRKNKKR